MSEPPLQNVVFARPSYRYLRRNETGRIVLNDEAKIWLSEHVGDGWIYDFKYVEVDDAHYAIMTFPTVDDAFHFKLCFL